jgi:hypothetical protein
MNLSVTDLAFVTYLRVSKRLTYIECRLLPDGSGHCEFIFEGTIEQLREAEREFLNGAQASVHDTIYAFKELREIINRTRRAAGMTIRTPQHIIRAQLRNREHINADGGSRG